jgi:hypothetical protein
MISGCHVIGGILGAEDTKVDVQMSIGSYPSFYRNERVFLDRFYLGDG